MDPGVMLFSAGTGHTARPPGSKGLCQTPSALKLCFQSKTATRKVTGRVHRDAIYAEAGGNGRAASLRGICVGSRAEGRTAAAV